MQSHAIPGARFVDPKVLSRVGNLELLARNVVEGFINGNHRAPPAGKRVNVVLNTLEKTKAERPGNLATPLNKMAEHSRRRGILVLISDFYEEPDTILEAIKPLKFLGNDLIVFHVLDPAELDFGYEDASSFEDLETGEQIPVVPESLVKEYRQMIQAHIGALTTKFSEHRT